MALRNRTWSASLACGRAIGAARVSAPRTAGGPDNEPASRGRSRHRPRSGACRRRPRCRQARRRRSRQKSDDSRGERIVSGRRASEQLRTTWLICYLEQLPADEPGQRGPAGAGLGCVELAGQRVSQPVQEDKRLA